MDSSVCTLLYKAALGMDRDIDVFDHDHMKVFSSDCERN